MNTKFVIQQSKKVLFSFNYLFFVLSLFMFLTIQPYLKNSYDVWLSLIIISAIIFWVFELINCFGRIMESIIGLEKHFDSIGKTELYYEGEN